MYGHHKRIAIEKLKCLRDRIDYLISCFEQGNPYAISINGDLVDLLFEVRDQIVIANFIGENDG